MTKKLKLHTTDFFRKVATEANWAEARWAGAQATLRILGPMQCQMPEVPDVFHWQYFVAKKAMGVVRDLSDVLGEADEETVEIVLWSSTFTELRILEEFTILDVDSVTFPHACKRSVVNVMAAGLIISLCARYRGGDIALAQDAVDKVKELQTKVRKWLEECYD